MTDLDELSRTIGNIEGDIRSIKHTQENQGEKIERIDNALTSHKVKTAGIAGGVSAAITLIGKYLWTGIR